jgi:dihydroxyacid dehydratase/phosphogluconate dehydratase
LTDKAIENAMVIHAAFSGSTNLLLHIPAIAYAAGCTILMLNTGRALTARCRVW